MKGFEKEYQAKNIIIYISQSSSSIFTEGEGEVDQYTHTHIKSDIVLYFKERFTSISPTSMTALHHCSSAEPVKNSHKTTLITIIIIPPNIPRSPPRNSINTRL